MSTRRRLTIRNVTLLIVTVAFAGTASVIAWWNLRPVQQRGGANYRVEIETLAAEGQPTAASDNWLLVAQPAILLHQAKQSVIEREKQEDRHARAAGGEPGPWSLNFFSILNEESPVRSRNIASQLYTALIAAGYFEQTQRIAEAERFVHRYGVSPFLSPGSPDEDRRAVYGLGELLAFRMELAIHERRYDDAAEALDQGLALSRACALQPNARANGLAMNVQNLMLHTLRLEISQGRITDVHARKVLAIIDARLPLPPLSRAIEGNRLLDRWSVSETWNSKERNSDFWFVVRRNVFGPSRADAEVAIDRCYGRLKDAADTPRAARSAAGLGVDSFALAAQSSEWERNIVRREIPGLIGERDAADALLAGVRVMCALATAQSPDGRFPTSLDELTPALLLTLPIDPFASDGRLVYEPRLDGSAYSLYSVGVDGRDDGGAPAPDLKSRPLHALGTPDGIACSGCDFVFHQ